MARKRRVSKRRVDLTPEQIAWLAGDFDGAGFFQFVDATDDFWWEHSERIVAEHVSEFPGTRPYHWWRMEAPRMKETEDNARYFYDGMIEPRKRLGGIGTPQFECLSVVPHFSFGIPDSWLEEWQVKYYSGLAKDIHNNPIGTEYFNRPIKGVAIDKDDPPVFEAQASYLKRHNLFLPGEAKRLTKEDFEPEAVL